MRDVPHSSDALSLISDVEYGNRSVCCVFLYQTGSQNAYRLVVEPDQRLGPPHFNQAEAW